MKEIGERFEEARENIGISIEEAAFDLKVEAEQIQNIEAGNIKAFDNVVSLKYLIRDYSKYLGMDAEEMLDEYNEFLFDCTSKISLEDIKAAKRKIAQNGTGEKPIRSPYTVMSKKKSTFMIFGLTIISILFLLLVALGIFYWVQSQTPVEEDTITYVD